jgi:hypothetical protein
MTVGGRQRSAPRSNSSARGARLVEPHQPHDQPEQRLVRRFRGLATHELGSATKGGEAIAGKLGEPLTPDALTAGCARLGVRLWSCGETQADRTRANPQNRVVKVTFMRNTPPAPQPQPPTLKTPNLGQ